jgi:hypothetical protein
MYPVQEKLEISHIFSKKKRIYLFEDDGTAFLQEIQKFQ